MNQEEKNNVEENVNENAVEETAVDQDLNESKEQLLRLMADFENYKRRTAEEKISLISTANEKLILNILPVVDNFERALACDNNEGFRKIYENLKNTLEKVGVKKLEVEGQEFDANLCDALMTEEGEENKILEVFEAGYELNGKVIRHAKVKIGA